MATLAELKAFADKTSYDIPYVDYQVGVAAGAKLKDYHSLPGTGTAGAAITYSASNNTVYVKGDNLVVSGYDFSGTTVVVMGNNVTVQNSKFDAAFGWYALTQFKGFSGLVVDHNTFDGLKIDKEYARFVNSGEGKITITYNEFKNAQTDAVELTHGLVANNYFNGTGYQTGAHADAIWVYKTTGPVVITNNFVDSRQPADAPTVPNNAVQIVNKFGDVHNVTVTKNVLLGGSYTVNVNDITDYKIDTVVVKDNFISNGLYGDLYPNFKPSDLVYQGNGATKITDLLAPPPSFVPGLSVKGVAGVVGEVLKGGDGADHIYGHGNGNLLIGGGGRDFLFGGVGEDIFVYKNVSDSSGKSTDIIANFQDSVDKIDLSALSNSAAFGKVALKFIGDLGFDGSKGAVHTVKSGASTWVEVDLNGDKNADLRVELQGSHSLTAGNFIFKSPSSAGGDTPAPPDGNPPDPVAVVSLSVKGTTGKVGEVLMGGAGSDHIYGHGDGNFIVGSLGRDFLFGGKGQDIFVYRSVAESSGRQTDVIGFFEDGTDKIDLHALASGGLSLKFIGSAAFTGAKGEIHAVQSGSSTWIEADMTGNKVADLRIELQGLHHLSSTDFLL